MFKQISEREFNSYDPFFRVIFHDHPRVFGLIDLSNTSHSLTLCWRSDLVEPIIESDPLSASVWIGVDQRVACISQQGNILFSAGLSSSLLQIKHFGECTIVLCEIQALIINHDYSLREICDLKEIADAVDVKEGQLTITFIDGTTEALSSSAL